MRFGESPLQVCNIIVKDVKDSKRNDNVIHK
jgi:anaphase-promoting complex subunit 2